MPGNKKSEKLQLLWNGFKEITWDLKLDFPTNGSINYLEEKIVGWFKIFSSLYWVKDVTTKLCKIVAYVNQLSMDKYNNVTSNNYFRFYNHRGITALWQLLQKKYQIQFLEAAGYERVKQRHHCSNCSSSGHTIKTCTRQCKHCNHQTCCSHLIQWEG